MTPIKHDRVYRVNTNVIDVSALITTVNAVDLSTVGKRISYAREVRGIASQKALADLVGVSQSTIGNLEADTRKRPRNLLKLAAAPGVNPEWLETGIGPMTSSIKLREDVMALAIEMQKLSVEQVAKIRALVLAFGPLIPEKKE